MSKSKLKTRSISSKQPNYIWTCHLNFFNADGYSMKTTCWNFVHLISPVHVKCSICKIFIYNSEFQEHVYYLTPVKIKCSKISECSNRNYSYLNTLRMCNKLFTKNIKQITITMTFSLCDKCHLVLKFNFTHTHIHTCILMELHFFFWILSLCSQILTMTHIYFLSIDTEVETLLRYKTFMRSKNP